MKKIISFVFGLSFILPVVASAASFVVSPSSGSYAVGDTITVNVSANPAGSNIYTAMLDARFSPETLQVTSFTINDVLLPLKQAGYDALNNDTGVLTKTGGYTGGITATAPFGVITLRAKAVGTGTFTVADNSKLLDSNNSDQQTGTQTASYTIVAKPVTQTTPTPQVASKVTTKKETQVVIKSSDTKTSTAVANATGTPATSTQVAAVGTSGTNSVLVWVLIVFGLLASFGVGYFTGFRKRRY